MKRRVLLLTNQFMDIYKDIITELELQNYNVTFFEDFAVKNDPLLIRNREWPEKDYIAREEYLSQYWRNFFTSYSGNLCFDSLLVIDGMSVCPFFIEELTRQNPHLRKVLYLYDRTYKNYRFDLNFKYFDKVFTFDRLDSEYYKIPLLPIYWVPTKEKEVVTNYSVFAFATFQKERYRIFHEVFGLCKKLHLPCYIKVYIPKESNKLRSLIKRLLHKDLAAGLDREMIATEPLSPSDFRRFIAQSEVILDTHNSFQDGLTARFMWAIGAGKKIITTNKSAEDYSFYNKQQIYILGEDERLLESFLDTDCAISAAQSQIVNQYRIDNWIKTLTL